MPTTITKIPVIPISYADAQPLLAALERTALPRRHGAARLPITYHIGPGPASVHLKMTSNWDTKTIYDVVARIPGSARTPIEWIIRGNHHDAWVNGADDPLSGQCRLNWKRPAPSAELLQARMAPKAHHHLHRVGR